MNRSNIFILIYFFILLSIDVAGQKDDYKLVWADEFNKDGPPDSANRGVSDRG